LHSKVMSKSGPPDKTPDAPGSREKRLAEALRKNLRRRKSARRPARDSGKPAPP